MGSHSTCSVNTTGVYTTKGTVLLLGLCSSFQHQKQAVTFIVLLRFGMAALGTEFCITKANFTMSSSGF